MINSIETKSGMVVARGSQQEEMGSSCSISTVSVSEDKKKNGGDGSTMM